MKVPRRDTDAPNGFAYLMRYWPLVSALVIFVSGYAALNDNVGDLAALASDNEEELEKQDKRIVELEAVQRLVNEKFKNIKTAQDENKALLREILDKVVK